MEIITLIETHFRLSSFILIIYMKEIIKMLNVKYYQNVVSSFVFRLFFYRRRWKYTRVGEPDGKNRSILV